MSAATDYFLFYTSGNLDGDGDMTVFNGNKKMRGEIVPGAIGKKLFIFDDGAPAEASIPPLYRCWYCGNHEFSWITIDYVFCLDCCANQFFELDLSNLPIEVRKK